MVTRLTPAEVLPTLRRSILADGLPIVLDLERSQGSDLVDAVTGEHFLDLFSFFGSNALGMNHPAMSDPAVVAELGRIALHKPSNSDVYTVAMAEFIDTFRRVLGDPRLPHLFFIEGGGLAVENALK
ncbi:MAG: L-lysine 6-transaminase, partial [Propionicimonas sp.]|nr:L-lysine 6-transaminase [Propionicimonas sp.]